MKRNLDVIRAIMKHCEEVLKPGAYLNYKDIPTSLYKDIDISMTEDEFMEHIVLLEESRLIVGKGAKIGGGFYVDFIILRITSNGYDFLDALRNDTIWTAAKEKANAVGGMALDTMIAFALDYAKKNLLGL